MHSHKEGRRIQCLSPKLTVTITTALRKCPCQSVGRGEIMAMGKLPELAQCSIEMNFARIQHDHALEGRAKIPNIVCGD